MRVISGRARGTKLNSLKGKTTRPTLDRVKESLFNIIQDKIMDSYVLDLFSGSGALGIECISRGCKKVVFCDKSFEAIKVIKQNIQKTRFEDQSLLIDKDYMQCLEKMHVEKMKFDIIFVDPPYETDDVIVAVERIMNLQLIKQDGIMILETDDEKRIVRQIEKIKDIEIYDKRKYGRIKLIFIKRKG